MHDDDEMAQDIADYDAAKRALADGGEMIPHAFVVRLIAGESPIRVWRELRGLSIDDLAERAGLGSVALAQIEAGQHADAAVMQRIADVLRVDPEDLDWG